MATYNGTFACGHEGEVHVIGPHKTREYIIEKKFSGLCPECWEKHLKAERERANKEALEKAKEFNLTKLTGSEKQVVWGTTLRQNLINRFDNAINKLGDGLFLNERLEERYDFLLTKLDRFQDKLDECEEDSERYEKYKSKIECVKRDIEDLEEEKINIKDVALIENYILTNFTEAKFYINNRDESVYYFLKKYKDEALKTDEEKMIEKQENELEEEINREATVYPEDRITDSVVVLEKDHAILKAKFEKNDKFREIVKNFRMTWENGCWKRSVNFKHGPIEDRMAELGNILLTEGFPVRIMDEKVRNMAINATFNKEQTRWVDIDLFNKILLIEWVGYNRKLYEIAKSIPTSKWDGGIRVKIEHADEVEDFARLYNFKFTDKAEKAITEHRENLRNIEVVNPKEKEKTKEEKDGLENILSSSTEILEDLIDED